MTIEIVDLPKLSRSQVGLTAAYRAGLILQEKGWMLYPAASWDKPALLAFEGQRCVAGLNFDPNEDSLVLSVDFAWSDQDRPNALAMLLCRFRAKFKDGPYTEIRFVCHEGNELMAKAVRVLGLVPVSHSYRMPVSAMARGARA